ncbi:MAG: hypothetical protein LBV33_03250 [Lachnospiraceae bacterium]|jgi:hypothetical protein|nr:hypothetical protein [Lachnospiraceae bacterium]
MKKKFLLLAGTLALCLSMTMPALAANNATTSPSGYGYGCGVGYGFMWDDDGELLDQDTFEDQLDEMIDDGIIDEEDREDYLERYEWCTTYGGAAGGRGCCGGTARGGRGMGGRGMGYRF